MCLDPNLSPRLGVRRHISAPKILETQLKQAISFFKIIDNLINAFYLYDDRVVIYFNIKGGKETSFIGKDETDEAIKNIDNNGACGVQTLTPPPRHARQCLNTDTIYYIFVNGVAGIVVFR